MQTNVSTVLLPETKASFKVVDIPGHPRLRDQFEEHLADAKMVAFVVDANTISRNGPTVAEYVLPHFHHILSLSQGEHPGTFTTFSMHSHLYHHRSTNHRF